MRLDKPGISTGHHRPILKALLDSQMTRRFNGTILGSRGGKVLWAKPHHCKAGRLMSISRALGKRMKFPFFRDRKHR